jgi:thioredoxin reductase
MRLIGTLKKQPIKKNVVIVGAGIAGMEAAWVAGARGHKVTVLGKSQQIGGKTRLHAGLPGGENLSSIYDYQTLIFHREKLSVRLGSEADVASVKALEPDIVVLATGSRMTWPNFLDRSYLGLGLFLDLRQFVTNFKHYSQKHLGRLVIYDKDHTEMTYAAAEFFADAFEEVVLITPRERIASDVSVVSRQGIYKRLYTKKVHIITSSEPCFESQFEDGKITYTNIYNNERTTLDKVVALTFATPRIPNDELLTPLTKLGITVHAIGDCYAPRSVLSATQDGHAVGLAI